MFVAFYLPNKAEAHFSKWEGNWNAAKSVCPLEMTRAIAAEMSTEPQRAERNNCLWEGGSRARLTQCPLYLTQKGLCSTRGCPSKPSLAPLHLRPALLSSMESTYCLAYFSDLWFCAFTAGLFLQLNVSVIKLISETFLKPSWTKSLLIKSYYYKSPFWFC